MLTRIFSYIEFMILEVISPGLKTFLEIYDDSGLIGLTFDLWNESTYPKFNINLIDCDIILKPLDIKEKFETILHIGTANITNVRGLKQDRI